MTQAPVHCNSCILLHRKCHGRSRGVGWQQWWQWIRRFNGVYIPSWGFCIDVASTGSSRLHFKEVGLAEKMEFWRKFIGRNLENGNIAIKWCIDYKVAIFLAKDRGKWKTKSLWKFSGRPTAKFPSISNDLIHFQARFLRQHAGFGDISGEQKHIPENPAESVLFPAGDFLNIFEKSKKKFFDLFSFSLFSPDVT